MRGSGFSLFFSGKQVTTDSSSVRHRSSKRQVNDARSVKVPSARLRISSTSALNILVGVLLLVAAYLAYAFLADDVSAPPLESAKVYSPSGKPIQLDVLNGCGVSGVASRITAHLRRKGFDVVDMRNYKTFDLQETLVIDRVGNLATARQVAQAMGVKRENVIQEINPDYFVDVSVVIGRDYPALSAMR